MKKIGCSLIWTLIFYVKNVVIGRQVSSSLNVWYKNYNGIFVNVCQLTESVQTTGVGSFTITGEHNGGWDLTALASSHYCQHPELLILQIPSLVYFPYSSTPWVAYPPPDPFSGVFSILINTLSCLSSSRSLLWCVFHTHQHPELLILLQIPSLVCFLYSSLLSLS
jgi:hypothetical protein